MEYLVIMTTHVPAETPERAVEDIRAREAAHSRELAEQGHLLRLWRPPLRPGEWRTLGLFAAAGDDQLEQVLTSMPLRVWRTDEVTRLSPHPNDPLPAPIAGEMAAEFLVTFTLAVPPGTADRALEDTKAREAQAARDLARRRHLLRLWVLPGAGRRCRRTPVTRRSSTRRPRYRRERHEPMARPGSPGSRPCLHSRHQASCAAVRFLLLMRLR
jgi:muconolactone delta-isomerase